jgi:hypothetical protein
MNKTKLLKLLAMIGSVHDGEALAAARAAHRMVESNKTTWAALISHAPSPAAMPEHYYTKAMGRVDILVMGMLKECLDSPLIVSTSREFITGLHNFYALNGYLSGKQLESLIKTWAFSLHGSKQTGWERYHASTAARS